jgi:2-aminoethylphosphonate transport system ATP-binding protein
MSATAIADSIAIPQTAPQRGSGIGFNAVSVTYKGNTVLDRLTLKVEPGEIMALIGPSGSGKTTALRAVAGFVRPSAGRVFIGDTDVTDLPPYARDIGMVVQNYALFPHMRVDENVAFGLRARRAPEALIQERIKESLRMVGMSNFITRYPREMSGGQQQRVAIARALAIQPRVLLLDEPLSALDAQIRRNMVGELAKLHRELPHLTVLYVTHDQSEALTLADRIAILKDGKVCAEDRSQMLYRAPPNRFAAEFLGRANLLPVTLGNAAARSGFVEVHLGQTSLLATAPRETLGSGECLLCVRPHALTLYRNPAEPAPHGHNRLTGTVTSVLWQGESDAVDLDIEGNLFRLAATPEASPPREGDTVAVSFAPDDATLIPAPKG